MLDVETGNALAYVGNIKDPGNKEMESDVDVIAAPRSPGSALKPILYAAMLSDGLILPNSIIADIPMQIGNYAPQNFDLGYDGAVPAANALARSLNIPAVKLLQQYKYQRLYETLLQWRHHNAQPFCRHLRAKFNFGRVVKLPCGTLPVYMLPWPAP